jgi:signal transduction histidine kinase
MDVVHESLDLVRPLADEKGLQLRVEGQGETTELYTDPRKLRQILVNVLGNAIKYSITGDIRLDVRIEGTEPCDVEPCVRVFFDVTDAGAGLSLADQAHVFDLYWQQDPTSTHTNGSSGLGLSVARQLARLLGGDVTIANSVLGMGSTFVVSLPTRYAGSSAIRSGDPRHSTSLEES